MGSLEILNGKFVILGDLHFGVSNFNIYKLKHQLKFITEQVFPYMEANNIKIIFQLGDLFDNRTSTDVNFIHTLRKEFFDILKAKGFILKTLVGNHDIYFRENRSVSLLQFFSDLYPDNFNVYNDRTHIEVNGNSTYIVPWITKGENILSDEIKDFHTILGHFEIQDFSMVKGIKDKTSSLKPEFFEKLTNVFSGHYHLKDTSGKIKYLGTPWQLTWADFDEEKGFYVWDELDNLEFFENYTNTKFIKITLDSNNVLPIIITGSVKETEIKMTYKDLIEKLNNNEFIKDNIKFIIDNDKDLISSEIQKLLKTKTIKFSVIDNKHISKIIGMDDIIEEVNESKEATLAYSGDVHNLLIEVVKSEDEKLLPLLAKLLQNSA